jgi:hypothetical protein
LPGRDQQISAACCIGMVTAIALYGDWLLPTARNKPKHRQIVDELVTMISLGGTT